MTHYVCTGSCRAENDAGGFCQTESCAMYGAPLSECGCMNGKHNELFDSTTNREGLDEFDLRGLDNYEEEY